MNGPDHPWVAERANMDWALFVDRDGVLNKRLDGTYVRDWSEFEWLPHAKRALVALGAWAPRIVIITNQQGVGKRLLHAEKLREIHRRMRAEVELAGGRLDAILVCPHLELDRCACRKPRPGMATTWLSQNPTVDGALSVMVGDSESDMQMADELAQRTGGCEKVRISPSSDESGFDSLLGLAVSLGLADDVADPRSTNASISESREGTPIGGSDTNGSLLHRDRSPQRPRT